MKRLLIFTVFFPPIALAEFTAPEAFKNLLMGCGLLTRSQLSPRG
jgi:hypothetical protein